LSAAKIMRKLSIATACGFRESMSFMYLSRLPRDRNSFRDCELAIVATKATQVKESFSAVGKRFSQGAVISAQNGLGSEEIIAAHTHGQVIRGTTFMSGTKHSDTHVQFELDTATWIGPFEPRHTAYAIVEEAARLDKSGWIEGRSVGRRASRAMGLN